MWIKLWLLLALTFGLHAKSAHEHWAEYKKRFIQSDGRIIDRVNGGITHSEAIGYALYFSYAFKDTETFEKVLDWYHNNMPLNRFGLTGWKWGKSSEGEWKMLDNNSAADGDLWIAYSLLLMHERRANAAYKDEAIKRLEAVKKQLLRTAAKQILLLPSEFGFEHNGQLRINPSYYLFQIFDTFSRYDNDPCWKNVINGGINMLESGRYSPLKLNPDWLVVDSTTGTFSPDEKQHRFGYDAIRIPLNIIMSPLSKERKRRLLKPYSDYVTMMRIGGLALGSVDLKEGNISMYSYSFGHLALYRMIERFENPKSELFSEAIEKRIELEKEDYYAYSLYLFTAL